MARRIALACLLLSSGCSDPLKPPELIEETRVLAARTEVTADAARASVRPLESARVRFLVVSPREPDALGWAFSACKAARTTDSRAICQAPSFFEVRQDSPAAGEPSFELELPDGAALSGAAHVAVAGVFCAGSAARAGSFATCDGGGRALQTSVEILVEDGEARNLNPAFASTPVSLDGASWPAPSASLVFADGCTDDLPRVPVGSEHVIGILPPAEARELAGDQREMLQISHFSDGGELDRSLSFVEADAADDAAAEVRWLAPASAADAGRLVRFYLVLRDLRGGVDWTERAVCVVP
jgi:hypothetical protein